MLQLVKEQKHRPSRVLKLLLLQELKRLLVKGLMLQPAQVAVDELAVDYVPLDCLYFVIALLADGGPVQVF